MPTVVPSLGEFTPPPAGSDTRTARQILDEAWNYLYSSLRVERDKLDGAIDDSQTTLDTVYLRAGIKSGAKLSIELEDMHVWSVVGATATVERGEFGSDAAAHADGTIVLVNAEFSPAEIFRQMNNELKSLSAPNKLRGAERTVTLTFNAARFGYDLTGVENVSAIERVVATTAGSDLDRVPVTDWRVEKNLDATSFPSGFGLFFDKGWPGRDVLVTYRVPFGVLSSLDDDVETTTGLPNSCFDILAMGAAIRCAAPTEIDRNQTGSQGSGRRASEVPAGARANALRLPIQQYRDRVSEEQDAVRQSIFLPRRY